MNDESTTLGPILIGNWSEGMCSLYKLSEDSFIDTNPDSADAYTSEATPIQLGDMACYGMDRTNAILDAAISLCRCQDEAQLQSYITRLQDVDPQFYGDMKLYLRQNAIAMHAKYDMEGEHYPDVLRLLRIPH